MREEIDATRRDVINSRVILDEMKAAARALPDSNLKADLLADAEEISRTLFHAQQQLEQMKRDLQSNSRNRAA